MSTHSKWYRLYTDRNKSLPCFIYISPNIPFSIHVVLKNSWYTCTNCIQGHFGGWYNFAKILSRCQWTNWKWLYSLIIRKAIWNGSEFCKSRRGQKYPCIQNCSWTGTCIYRTLYMRRVSWACKTYKIIHASWRSSFTYGGHLVLIISTPVV